MIIHPLRELSRADVATAGGKGANLGEMIQRGLPVPPGFVVSAKAYADQAQEWGLAERLGAHLDANDWQAAASAAAQLFERGAMLPRIESAIRAAYRDLGAPRCAVRSSATAEDLASASFAGQQETYLDVAEAIRSGRIEDLKASGAGRTYLALLNAFLDDHGHREGACLYLSAPTWKQDPSQVFGLLRGFMHVSELREEGGTERYRAALLEVEGRLGAVPGLAGAFRGLLDRVRAIIVFRENTHFDLSRPLSVMQSAVAEIGRRLHDRGLLPSPADVFYLTDTEVRAWLGGDGPSKEEAERLLKRRRTTYQVVNGRWQERRASGGATGNELRGAGASAGVVRAKARIVRGEHQFDRLQPGEILVCSYTNPSWTPLFSYAAGVVTDTGGSVSHAAIVAREYGIPAVMGAVGATERITDGQEILVDGTEGRVRLF